MKNYLARNLKQICADLGVDALSVFSRREEERKVYLEAWAGDKPREHCPFGVTPLGECAETGEALSSQKKHVRVKYQSEIVLPIFEGDTHVGVLQCVSVQKNFFQESFLPKIKAVVDLIEKNWST